MCSLKQVTKKSSVKENLVRKLLHDEKRVNSAHPFTSVVDYMVDYELYPIKRRDPNPIASLVHFFYVAATKLFVLKVIYGIIFYVVLTKGWHLLLWLVHYLKEKPHEYIEYEPHDHHHHEPYDHSDHYAYYDRVQHLSYDTTPRGKIAKVNSFKKGVYDSDGSYSVLNPQIAYR